MGDRPFRKNPGGPWYGWFYTPDGQRIRFCTYCTDRRAATLALREREREAFAPARATTDAGTLEDALRYMIEDSSSDVAEATLGMYAQKAGHLLRLMGSIEMRALHHDDVQRYVNARLAEKAARGTVQKELIALRRTLALAKQRGKLRTDPRDLIPKFKAPYTPRERYLRPEQVEALLAVLEPGRRLWVALAVFTSGRLSEVERLRWEHVNLAEGTILLPGRKTARSRRRVPIRPELAALLEALPTRDGPLVEPWANVRRDLAVACKHAGVPKVTPNDLRRTFCSLLKQQGTDSMVVARLMGHSSTRMVDLVYGQLAPETYTAAMRAFPAIAVTAAAPPEPEEGTGGFGGSGDSTQASSGEIEVISG